MIKILATGELFLAASLWGFGFVATVWAMERVGPIEMCFLRFFTAVLLMLPFLFSAGGREGFRESFRKALWPGLLLALTLVTQTWALKYTTPTKSGFITTLYVVFIPFLESWLDKRRLPRLLWACVAVSFFGTCLIVNVGIDRINPGDLLTLVTAFLATGQIYLLGRISPGIRHPFIFNAVQSGWAALVCLPVAFNLDLWRRVGDFPNWPGTAQTGLLALALGSTVIAFALQVRAQARLSPTVSSLLFLLESPFAMVFSVVLLDEVLGPVEAAGAALIFLSAVGASLLESRRKKY